jgi:hypothetical protein
MRTGLDVGTSLGPRDAMGSRGRVLAHRRRGVIERRGDRPAS